MHQEGPLRLCLLGLLQLSSAARDLLVPGLLPLLCKLVIQCREASPTVFGCCCSAAFPQSALWSCGDVVFPSSSLQR